MKKFINKIHNIDIKELIRQLPSKSIDMIYSDVDYNKGIRYDGVSYSKNFNEYMGDYIYLAVESMRALKDTGSAFFINYPRNNAFLWTLCLDKIAYDVQQYAWVYRSNIGHSPNRFTTAHRSILHARKTKNSVFYKNNVAEPYINQDDKRIKGLIKSGSKGRAPYSWFYADIVKNVTKEKAAIKHPCIIPDKVSALLVQSVTMPGDIVLIAFAGSGSEINVCRKLERNWISAELNKNYCEKIRKQLNSQFLEFERM